MADTITKEISYDDNYTVAFEERFVWVSFFEGQRQRRAIVTRTVTSVSEEAPFAEIEPEVITGFPPSVEIDPSSSLDYTITNVNWRRDQDAYYTKVTSETTVTTTVGAWTEIETGTT